MRKEAEEALRKALKHYQMEKINLSGSPEEINALLHEHSKSQLHFAHIFDCCAPEIGLYTIFWEGMPVISVPDDVAAALRSLR